MTPPSRFDTANVVLVGISDRNCPRKFVKSAVLEDEDPKLLTASVFELCVAGVVGTLYSA